MGWRKFKEHFQIHHIVQLNDKGLCIGSPYIYNLATIDLNTGKVLPPPTDSFAKFLHENYPQILKADPNEILELLQAEDEFTASIPVYTYKDGEIIEKFCEIPNWPNVTHDGHIMYENTFSTEKDVVVGWAKRNADSAIENILYNIAEMEEKLAKYKAELAKQSASRERLESMYPTLV